MKKYLILLIALFLVGCDLYPFCETVEAQGVVVDKSYQAPYDSSSMECMARDSKYNCQVWTVKTTHHSASYTLFILYNDNRYIRSVGQGLYESVAIEGWVSFQVCK